MRRKTREPAGERRRVRLVLTDIAHGGAAIGRDDGRIVFVRYGSPGDEVTVELVEEKSSFARGRIVETHTAAPCRRVPPCPYFGTCGGCQWQHLDYAAQLTLKRQVVIDQLRRIGGFVDVPVHPTIGMVDPWGYRNNARFSTGRDGQLGFTRVETFRFLPIEACLIVYPRINEVLAALQGRGAGLHQVVVRYGIRTGQLLVQPAIPGDDLAFETGQSFFEEEILGRRFRISPSSFFQVNTKPEWRALPAGLGVPPSSAEGLFSQAEILALVVADRLALGGEEVVVDAYCGVGTFALLLAERARRIIGVEEARSAIKDAEWNRQGAENVTFIEGKTEKVLPGLEDPVDAVVLDPARAGCEPAVIGALLERRPRRIVYVSCEPSTLVRDLRRFCDGGYRLIDLQPIDMFPQTYHIETVAVLEGGS